MEKELDAVLKKLKAKKLQALTKNLLMYEIQGNLTRYFFDYAMLCIKKTPERNG